jgi:hypothetical protein
MTIDLSEFFTEANKPCAIGRFLESLEEKERETLLAAFAHPDVTTASIHRWIDKRGLKTTANTIRTHRAKRCNCA